LNYEKYFSEGEKDVANMKEYNSNNTYRLNIKELKKILLKLDIIRNEIKEINK
jgi:UDP-glucose 4-epimerase